jgi:hypothetical protein
MLGAVVEACAILRDIAKPKVYATAHLRCRYDSRSVI